MAKDFLYAHNSILIVAVLFVLIMLAQEAGYRIGRHHQRKSDKDVKSQTSTIQAGTLGLLALILGFAFSMSLQTYNSRTEAVVNEASAIRTALMRTHLLPAPYDSLTHVQLQQYVDLRLALSNTNYAMVKEQEALADKTEAQQRAIWDHAVKAARLDPNPVTTGYFATALNQMVVAHDERNALLAMHVPEVILYLLFIVFIMAGALIGYGSGLGQRRTNLPSALLSLMICLVVFIIIDLDRPMRGIVKVDQHSLERLKSDRNPQQK
jgi:cellobiose-specific phosphotransferase system component IIC